MKRSALLILLIFCLFCGCTRHGAASAQPPQLAAVQDRTVFIRTSLTQMTAAWHYDGGSDFVLAEPASLDGLKISCTNGDCSASLGDTAVPFPQSAAFAQIDKAFRTLLHGSVIPVLTQEGWKYDGSLYGFTAIQDPSDGRLRTMHFPKSGITVTFEP